MGPRSTSARPTLAGSVALEHIRSNEIGTAESMLAQVGRDGDEARDEEKSGDGRDDDQPQLDCDSADYPDGGWKAWSVVFGVFALVCCQMGCTSLSMICRDGVADASGCRRADLGRAQPEAARDDAQGSAAVDSKPLCWIVQLCESLLYRRRRPRTERAARQTMNGSSFVSGRLGDRYGYKVSHANTLVASKLIQFLQRMIAFGIVATFISLLISSFVSASLPLLFVFQGFFLGLSQGLGYVSPSLRKH